MKISLLCSNKNHPVNGYLEKWVNNNESFHEIELVRNKSELSGGDILFLISCAEIINKVDRDAYRASLVLHASDLPKGRGWNPHIWQIMEGAKELTLSLLEAEDKVDSGDIWKKIIIDIPKDMLWNEINERLFNAETQLIDFAVNNIDSISPVPQDSYSEPTYYSRRYPADSQIDPNQSIASQFNKIRVSDPIRFPAYFELFGHTYKITLEKVND